MSFNLGTINYYSTEKQLHPVMYKYVSIIVPLASALIICILSPYLCNNMQIIDLKMTCLWFIFVPFFDLFFFLFFADVLLFFGSHFDFFVVVNTIIRRQIKVIPKSYTGCFLNKRFSISSYIMEIVLFILFHSIII